MQGNQGQEQHDARIATHVRGAVSTLQECDARGLSFVSARECAAILRSDPRTVRRSIAAGDIPATKVGQQYRVPVSWVREQAREAGAA